MKRRNYETDQIFYISDLHLFHPAILSKCKRPFNSIDEMHNSIMENWKRKVKKNDIVYILGDVGMYHQKEIADFLNSLPGKKVLITGNHDKFNLRDRDFRNCFISIKPYDEIFDKERKVVLFHYPIEEWDGFFRSFYHLHGHVHNQDDSLVKLDRRFNVSADVLGFEPKTLDELIEMN
jgi:calcineurin-like phosphoesterase family protein